MADSASLAGSTAADNVNHDVELAIGVGQSQRAADHQLQGFQAEVIVDITIVDGNLAGAIVDADAGNGMLTTASAVEILFSFVHLLLPPYQNSTTSGFWAACACSAVL